MDLEKALQSAPIYKKIFHEPIFSKSMSSIWINKILKSIIMTWVRPPTLSKITHLLRPTQAGKPSKKDAIMLPSPYAKTSYNLIKLFILNFNFTRNESNYRQSQATY